MDVSKEREEGTLMSTEWADCTRDEYLAAVGEDAPHRYTVEFTGKRKSGITYQADTAWLDKHREPKMPWEVLPDGLYHVITPMYGTVVRVADGGVLTEHYGVVMPSARDVLTESEWYRIPDQPAWVPGELGR